MAFWITMLHRPTLVGDKFFQNVENYLQDGKWGHKLL
jgi:hypothetical protein